MAVTIQTLQDGLKNVVVVLQIAADNADAVVVDYSTLSGVTTNILNLSIVEIQWSLTGAGAILEWDATTDTVAANLSAGSGFFLFPKGLVNNSGTGKTGDLLLTNAAEVTAGTILLTLQK
jgi:hypothetical protein